MKKLHFDQQWITRVTSDHEDDFQLVGSESISPPSRTEITNIFANISDADSIKEMVRRKWFTPSSDMPRNIGVSSAIIEFLFPQNPHKPSLSLAPLFRRQEKQRSILEQVSTLAWVRRISEKAMDIDAPQFNKNNLTEANIKHLVWLSAHPHGPRKAITYLHKLGIRVIIENGLPSMRTDGAAFILANKYPIIGLTLRNDRLDNFWFTLLHEVAHLILHLDTEQNEVFVDDIEEKNHYSSEIETEADAFAKDSFIPRDIWNRNAIRLNNDKSIIDFSISLKISPSIVAGRLRFERKDYTKFSHLLGLGEIRKSLLNE
jgi:HTH-type transcriptional regulator / antitoxin HigA